MTNELSFSQRMGYNPIRDNVQIESIDNELLVSLWNCLFNGPFVNLSDFISSNSELGMLMRDFWTDYLYFNIDEFTNHWISWRDIFKKKFFTSPWFEVFDILEFIASRWKDNYRVENYLIPEINKVLAKEMSGYRFLAGKLTQITSEEELSEIEDTLDNPEIIDPAKQQIISSIEKLSDRENPDYRGSIKESISAVETIAILLSGNSNTTLGKALSKIEEKGEISVHPALKKRSKSYTDGQVIVRGFATH